MTSNAVWRLRQLSRTLWVRATLISLLAVAAALFAFLITPYLPEDLSADIGAEAVDNILSIIASSMLAVTTFSLSTMITAYGAATSNVTPRATRLIMEDSTTQNVLASFVGSFLFSLVAIITLSMGAYGERGRIVLFVVTIFVIVLIVATLLRWIDYLMRLGRVGETTMRVEEAAINAMRARQAEPYLGGQPLMDEASIPPIARPGFAEEIGCVGHIDTGAIQRAAEAESANVFILALPGTFIDTKRPIAMVVGGGEDVEKAVAASFSIDHERTFDQDPRFGVIVLSEIGQRALSAAFNDAGTVIDVIGRSVRVLSIWGENAEEQDIKHARVHVPPVLIKDLFDDFFLPIGRDGAGLVEVQVRLQKALGALSCLDRSDYAENARRHSEIALKRAKTTMSLDEDFQMVAASAQWNLGAAS